MGDAKVGDCVKVAIRMRPLSKKELGNNESSIIELEESTGDGAGGVNITDPDAKEKPAQFAFDIVFGTTVLQQTVYECIGKPALDSMFSGYNGTIFAYGQTGSGKSWSMMGGDGELRGIIPRVNEQLFVAVADQIAAISTRRFLVMCSFFEIYNEIIFDLLNPCQDRSKLGAGLQVKEHPVLGIYVKDLQEIVVDNADRLGKLMDSGTKNRAVSSTLMNAVSSRSHSIFTIKVHQKDDEDKSRNVFAKLNLVDLAGSERQKGTGASGQTLKEGANINKSLSALGNVINALVENANGKKVFVPFRNSKLTRVLQESLGGNSLCTMLAALSPAACNFEETMSTLRYANRAKAIKVSATKNEEASQISRLNAEIEELKKKLGQAGGGGGGGGVMADEERQAMREKFQQQLSEMTNMVSSTWEEKKNLSVEQEKQMNKAMEEHKRQQRAMQEERRKRFRLLQDQGDLELSIRGLLDTVQALPAPAAAVAPVEDAPAAAEGADATAAVPPAVPCAALRSGQVLKAWLKAVASLASLAEDLKQQSTMAMLFHNAFVEDLKLWVEGEESHDRGMARTGSRRALTKLDTLRRECAKLASMEEDARQQVGGFAMEVGQVLAEWTESGRPAVLAQFKAEAEAENENDAQAEKPDAGKQDPAGPSVGELNVADVGKILELVARQAEARVNEFGALASLELAPTAALVLRGTSFVSGSTSVGPEADHVRQLAAAAVEGDSGSATASLAGTAAGLAAGEQGSRPPREELPLHEWLPEDTDDSVAGTYAALVRLMPSLADLNKKRPPEELLARPPPKYIHDVALLCTKTTGAPPGISEEWPESREGKLDILEQIAAFVSTTLGLENLDFDPEHVLKGKEVPRTLRMLQMLAIAAARSTQGGGHSAEANNTSGGKNGLTRAGALPAALSSIEACLECAADCQARDGGDGHASPTRELESNCRLLQERIQEEEASRQRLSDGMEELRRQVEESRGLLAERSARLEEVRSTASDVSSRKQEMQEQLKALREGLLQRAQQLEGNPEVVQKRRVLAEYTARSSGPRATRIEFSSEVKQLQQRQVEAATTMEKLEMEVKRIKLRLATGMDGPTLHQSEDILLMQAEKQKWEVRVHGLEEKMMAIAEADDLERQQETASMEQKQLHSSKTDDVAMQLQVLLEERDGLRDGNEKLWLERTRKEEELDDTSAGYSHASDRLMEKEEEVFELREQIDKFEGLKALLQENFEKSRQSPGMSAAVPRGESPASPPLPLPPINKPDVAPQPPPPKSDEEDGGSSHYSEDAFEDPDED